jgi:Spy/CpxP family protein refolding chaperone
MKTLKYALMGVLAVALVATASAQTAPTNAPAGPGKMGQHQDKLVQELNMTPEQVTKWKAIRETFVQQVKTVRENASLTEEQKKTQLEALRATLKTQIEGVLTPEQLAKLEALKKEHKGAPGFNPGHGPGGPAGGPPQN